MERVIVYYVVGDDLFQYVEVLVEFEFFYIVRWCVMDKVCVFSVGYEISCVEIVDVVLFVIVVFRVIQWVGQVDVFKIRCRDICDVSLLIVFKMCVFKYVCGEVISQQIFVVNFGLVFFWCVSDFIEVIGNVSFVNDGFVGWNCLRCCGLDYYLSVCQFVIGWFCYFKFYLDCEVFFVVIFNFSFS